MKQIIEVASVALVTMLLIVLATWIVTDNIEIGAITTYSITGIQEKEAIFQRAEKDLNENRTQLLSQQSSLQKAKNKYEASKNEYESITDEMKNTIREAYKEKQYYIEWLWVVLGNYATSNNLAITIIEPEGSNEGTVKLTVVGRYADVADFVFEVENDQELTFKLDNMSMKYASDNKIEATFDVLDMMVLKSIWEGEE